MTSLGLSILIHKMGCLDWILPKAISCSDMSYKHKYWNVWYPLSAQKFRTGDSSVLGWLERALWRRQDLNFDWRWGRFGYLARKAEGRDRGKNRSNKEWQPYICECLWYVWGNPHCWADRRVLRGWSWDPGTTGCAEAGAVGTGLGSKSKEETEVLTPSSSSWFQTFTHSINVN